MLLAALLLGGAPTPAAPIRAEALRAHMKFLASDLLDGRRTGTRGYDLAAAYVAAGFEAAGLAPGAAASYFQPVPLREGRADIDAVELTLLGGSETRRLEPRRDFLPVPSLALGQGEVEAPVVYVGFGVSAPERGYDDYAGLDVRGKIVLMAGGAPAGFPGDERAHYSSSRGKRENAVAHGAAGMISFALPQDQQRHPWSRVVSEQAKGANAWRHADGRIEDASPQLQARAILSPEGAEEFFGGRRAFESVVSDAEAGRPNRGPLGVSARLRVVTRHRDYTSPNVVGVIEGADPALRDEAVVFSAHLDHEGLAEGGGDGVHNGFFDNASGVASLVEIARALSAEATAPARSIVFLACVAEEQGLLGSDYFAHHPSLKPVANLNTDMFLGIFPLAEVVAFGASHSTLGEVVGQEAPRAGFRLAEDPFPREIIFIRSDQYAFVRRGVPALMIAAGFGSREPGIDGRQAILGWLRERYHRPSDDASQPVDWESMVRYAELNRRIVRRLASDPARPRWKDGDFFGRLFGAGS
jgi:hypothetical protein